MMRNLATSVLRRRRTVCRLPSSLPLPHRPRLMANIRSPRYLSSNNNNSSDDPLNQNKVSVDPRLSEWIPPDRPLVGDKGYTYLYETEDDDDPSARTTTSSSDEEELARIEREVKLLEDEENLSEEEQLQRIEQELAILDAEEKEQNPARKKKKKTPVQPQKMDWLQTRRQQLGDDLTPSFQQPGHVLPVVHHTLLTAQEIMDFLSSLGGRYPNLVEDQITNEHGDTRMGGVFRGIIFVTGHSTAHLRMLATSLVQQLKKRKLQEIGVMGARHGSEGSSDPDENWFCIDCHNYVVNIQDEETRRTLNLEGWWSKADPLAEYYAAYPDRNDDEEAMDDFVARNPVPPNYGWSNEYGRSSGISELQQKRYTAPHKPVDGGRRRRGRKARR